MSITIDLQNHGLAPPSASAVLPTYPGDGPLRLLILKNPGRVSRFYMEGLIRASQRIGLEHRVIELGGIWELSRRNRTELTRVMTQVIRTERIGAVLSYVFNGLTELECTPTRDGRLASLWESAGIPHLMLWTDHPQWATEKVALNPKFQPMVNSPTHFHFMKSRAAAVEIERVLGWQNCFGLPVAEDPGLVHPAGGSDPQYDVVAVLGSPPRMPDELLPFLEQDDPQVDQMQEIVARIVQWQVQLVIERDVPASKRSGLEDLCREWISRRQRDRRTASFWHFDELRARHTIAARWLLEHPTTYFDIVEHLWQFGGWQRTFVLRYLARYFNVGVLGADWSSVGLVGGEWVAYERQGHAYAQGRIAVNVSQGSEEEGVSHKPFQIAAAAVPMVHVDQEGLGSLFEVGREVEVFSTPSQAREIIQRLLRDPPRRKSMARAAYERFLRDHTWENRLAGMFQLARIPMNRFCAANSTIGPAATTHRAQPIAC